eukprot:11998764-Alexandrium_andersonii.AAC.1
MESLGTLAKSAWLVKQVVVGWGSRAGSRSTSAALHAAPRQAGTPQAAHCADARWPRLTGAAWTPGA